MLERLNVVADMGNAADFNGPMLAAKVIGIEFSFSSQADGKARPTTNRWKRGVARRRSYEGARSTPVRKNTINFLGFRVGRTQ